MKLQEITLPPDTGNEIQDYFYNIRLLLNNGRYQISVYSISPTVNDSGEAGELRLVIEGAQYRLYTHDGTSWYYTTMTKVT